MELNNKVRHEVEKMMFYSWFHVSTPPINTRGKGVGWWLEKELEGKNNESWIKI